MKQNNENKQIFVVDKKKTSADNVKKDIKCTKENAEPATLKYTMND